MNKDEKNGFCWPVQASKMGRAELLDCAYKCLKVISDRIIFFISYAEFLMLRCGDIDLNRGSAMCYEYFFNVSEKNNLRYVHLNFQDVPKKHT